MPEQCFLYAPTDTPWIEVCDGNDTARAIFDRHYSRYHYADGRKPKLFVGPGRKLVLLTQDAKALFVWRKFIPHGPLQEGYNCAVFRNEGEMLSSWLISAADRLIDDLWGTARHYTYVNPRKVRSINPGCCFLKAGWRRCGITAKRNYLILERPCNA